MTPQQTQAAIYPADEIAVELSELTRTVNDLVRSSLFMPAQAREALPKMVTLLRRFDSVIRVLLKPCPCEQDGATRQESAAVLGMVNVGPAPVNPETSSAALIAQDGC